MLSIVCIKPVFVVPSVSDNREWTCHEAVSAELSLYNLPEYNGDYGNTYKKLSYCWDSRSYCVQKYDRLKQLLRDTLSILTPSLVYTHCDRSISTCE